MPTRRGAEKGELWRGYRRPIWRDQVLWLAVGIGVAGVVVQEPLDGWEGTTTDWVVLALQVLLTVGASLVIVGVLAATLRGFGEGWRAGGHTRPAPTAERPATPAPEPPPEPAPEPAPAATAEPTPTAMEKQARSLGRAFGAARRTYRQPD